MLVFSKSHDLVIFDRFAALVFTQALAREDPYIDDRAFHARRNSQGCVTHFAGLLAENRSQQLFFRRKLGFTLRRNLADQDIAWLDLRPDANDAALIEIGERLIPHVRNVASYFFRAKLGITRDALELFDVYRGINILFDHALAN